MFRGQKHIAKPLLDQPNKAINQEPLNVGDFIFTHLTILVVEKQGQRP